MILLIDNYDSFTYNIYQYLLELGADVKVVRNDKITTKEIETLKPEKLLLSPGPGRPEDAGITLQAIGCFAGKIPILGVCLGHQAIGHFYGGKIIGAKRLMHGKTSKINADGKGVFAGINEPFEAMRYHSLSIERETLPDCLEITASSEDGEIMGVRHKTLSVEGIQFHPESIMTPQGKKMLDNFRFTSGKTA
ncbi:MAG: aminodeoxychorismate/anthranilate synthase component II [Fibromonadaceae bacterium]|jgi:anthranilate synthase/aminodeoxychorismate synthase-like glutamine amidotransferase|nr:aminodeoxychorismate/anthranilate synthase component II [Fibromonadaceae bacterium]